MISPPRLRASIDRMFHNVEEVVSDHLAGVLSGSKSHGGDSTVRAYIGLEPSGKKPPGMGNFGRNHSKYAF